MRYRVKKKEFMLSDDCYNLIMFWTLIVQYIINGNWMMSWDCNTSQSIFNAGMSFRYVFWADHYAFKPLFLILVSFSLFVFFSLSRWLLSSSSCSSYFFFSLLHCMWILVCVCVFFFGENAIIYTPDDEYGNICFLFSFTFCFKLSSQRAINEIQLCTEGTALFGTSISFFLSFVRLSKFLSIHIIRAYALWNVKVFWCHYKKRVEFSVFG